MRTKDNMSFTNFFSWRHSPPKQVEKSLDETRREVLEKEKQEATNKGKPWVAVLDTHVDPKNIKNGFFELDWNNEFIEQLVDAGYKGQSPEEIVEGWFKTVAHQILGESNA